MFTTATLFRIAPAWLPMLSSSLESMQPFAFEPCAPSAEISTGWVSPRGEKNGPLVEVIAGQWLLSHQIEKKAVPGALVRRRVEERCAQIEEATGRKPGKRERKELKEEVIMQLLPMAFPALKQIPVWIDPKQHLLVIGTASSTQADGIVTALVRSLAEFSVNFYTTKMEGGTTMSLWLESGEPPAGFTIDRDCELREPKEGGAVVRYQNHPLDVEEVMEHARSMRTAKLGMTWADRVSFELADDLSIGKIAFLGGGDMSTRDGQEDEFDATAAIATGELSALVEALTKCLGGLEELPPDNAVSEAARKLGESAREMGGTISIKTGDGVNLLTLGDGPDPLYGAAVAVVREEKKPSISLVQRHLKIGYNRAARMLERMEAEGIVSTMDTQGARAML